MTKIIPLLVLALLIGSCSIKKVIYVADSYADCKNTTSLKCLQVKENMEDDWIVLQNGIEGFDYKEGFTHKIEVEIAKVKNATNNESNLKYKFVKVIYQEESNTNQDKVVLSGNWIVFKLIDIDKLNVNPTLNFDSKTNNLSGKAGCNRYGTSFSIEGDQLKFGIPVATKMSCTNINIERAFFDCLQNTSYYKYIDGNLIFYSKDGKEQMTCSKMKE